MNKYPLKILIAFNEALNGNKKIYEWLVNNKYPELAALISGIKGSVPAYKWLSKHKFLAFCAFIDALEEDIKALEWLKNHKFDLLLTILLYCKGDIRTELLLKKKAKIYFYIAKSIKDIYTQTEKENEDMFNYMYRISKPFHES